MRGSVKRNGLLNIPIFLTMLVVLLGVVLSLSSCKIGITPDAPEKSQLIVSVGVYTFADSSQMVAYDNSNDSSRSAVPSEFKDVNGNDLVFAASLYESGGSAGNKIAAKIENLAAGELSFPFTVSSTARSNYVLEIFAYEFGTTDFSTPPLLSGKITGIEIEADALVLDAGTVQLLPHSGTTNYGGVNLSLIVPSEYKLKCDNGSFSCDGSAGKYTFTDKRDVLPDDYNITFMLFKDDSNADSLVYAWSEIIHVYPGMKTDKWNTGAVNSDGARVVSNVQILSTFYVRGSSGTDGWYQSLASTTTGFSAQEGRDDKGDGSIGKPYATVQKAVDKVLAMNGGADGEEYTIFVDGTVTTTENSSSLVTIKYLTQPLNLKISGIGSDRAILSGGMNPRDDSNARVIQVAPESDSASKINKKIDLTLANLIIQNGGGLPKLGDGAWTSGGGIFVNCETTANIVLDNVQVKDCTALWGGGALFSGACNVVLQNNTVFGDLSFHTNGTTATESNCSNFATGNGAGFTAQGDKVNVTIKNGCYVTGNYLKRNSEGGGGILYRTSDVSTKLTLEEGAFVSYNATSGTVGGGIFIEKNSSSSSLAVISGSIIGNKAGTKGNGIYCDDKITLSGAAKIDSNNDIYLPSGKVVTIADNLTKSGTVARISLDAGQYAIGTTVLQAATTNTSGTALSDDAQKALITNNIGKFILNKANSSNTVCEDFYLTPDSTGKNAVLAKPNVGVSVELAVGEYTFKVLKNGEELQPNTLLLAGDELSFKVYNSSNVEVTNVENYKIAVKQNGDEIPKLTKSGADISAVKVTIPQSLAEIDGVVDVFVSAMIDGVTYDASVKGVRVTTYAEVAVGDLLEYLKTHTGQVAVSMKADTAEDIAAIKAALSGSGVTATGVDLKLTGDVTSLDNEAFLGCSLLTSVEIPSGVTSIGDRAFLRCSSLLSIKFLDTTNWYVDSSETLTYTTAIDVTNASTNATNLNSYSGAWCAKYLHKKPVTP